jgi:LysM repeat protein
MGLIDSAVSKIPGGASLLTRKVAKPDFVVDDFPDGFIIIEYENGKQKTGKGGKPGKDDVQLTGPFMPHAPFKYGGEQRLVKDYYPGNSEPAVQVLGPKETDLTINGELKLKRFKRVYSPSKTASGTPQLSESDVRSIAENYAKLIDAMRIRGNLVQIRMGKWHRWAFIEKVEFEFNHLASIKYQIDFFIVGFNQPLNTKISGGYDDDLTRPNTDLTTKALSAIAAMQQFPASMPQSLADFLNGEIAKVAGAIALVTGFVNEALKDIENINQSFNRALGLLNNARAFISQSGRRINAVATDLSTLGNRTASQWNKTVATIESINHIHQVRYNYGEMLASIQALSAFISLLRQTTPLGRYAVKTGDSLQRVSNKYYGTPDNWRAIYDHNKLNSTNLVVGSVLEIPKV